MDKNTILQSMEYIDPKQIEDADCGVKSSRINLKKTILIAACICLLVLTTALAASLLFDTVIEQPDAPQVSDDSGEEADDSTPAPEQESDPQPLSTKVPVDVFSDDFLADVANKPDEEAFFYQDFATWSSMEEYIGFNMFDNSALDNAVRQKSLVNGNTAHCYITCGEMDGKLTYINAGVTYWMDSSYLPGIPVQYRHRPAPVYISASVYTEYSVIAEEDMFPSFHFRDEEVLSEETYISPSGHSFQIDIMHFPRHENNVLYFRCQLCLDNVYITITVQNQRHDIGLAALKEILASFAIN